MIRKSVHRITLTVLTLLCFIVTSKAQYASEDELKTAADKLFEEEKYVEALPLFSQLLSNYPKEPSYNYKYGACVLFGSRDKDNAIKYLEFAASKANVDPIAYYFLAKAYHHNYQFAPAIVNYNKFQGKTSTKDHQKYQVGRNIKMCQNGERLLKSMTDIGVLSKKEIKDSDFFRSYNLRGIGGKIIVKPDEFKTKLDKKNNENSIIYLGEKKDVVVYSSYGNTGTNGKDLYQVTREESGDWGKPLLLEGVNSNYDEDYPFLHPDGKTLYFSSKGYNSMGGYDIFKSTLNPATGQWSAPENLDFPINTPDDDILYISDIDNELAFFASSRASKQGEITVYKVTVDAPPVENSIIKGFFLAESNPNMKSATITVKDAEKDRRYGVYKTHNVTGEYLLSFPKNGGKFKILVETTNDAPIHSAIIELPVLDGFRALKQELRLVGEGDDEKLVVKNLFDESDEFDINDPLVVENILKQRAKLDVNTTEEELNNSLANSLNNALNKEPKSKYQALTDDQLINSTDETASKILDQTETSKKQANTSYQLANEKSTQAKMLYAESEKLTEEANSAGSESEKKNKLAAAEAKKMEAAKLVNETVAALAIARTLDNEVTERNSDVNKVKTLQENINANIDQGDRAKAEENLKELDEIASATYHNESALETEEKVIEKKLEEKKDKYNDAKYKSTELLNREYELTETINKLEAKKEATKKKSEKEDLNARIKALTIDVEDTKFDLVNAKKNEAEAEAVYNEIKNQASATKLVIASVNDGTQNSNPVQESSKLQIENDIAYFEKEGLVGLYPSENQSNTIASNQPYVLAEHKDDFNIIDDAGEIKDYNTDYSSQLAEVDNTASSKDRARIVMKINESWIKDIDEEISIRTNQLAAETNPGNKKDLENKIASLKALKSEKQREINENTQLLASNSNSNQPSTNNNQPSTNNTTTEPVNIMNTDGSVKDYSTQYTNELEQFSGEDDYDSYSKKAAIHTNWASATEQELLLKKMELAEADEAEKNNIENQIAVLENNLQEQNEFVTLYNMQAESVKSDEPLANNEEPATNNNQPSTNNEEPTTNNNQPSTNTEEPTTNNNQPSTNNEEPTTNNNQSVANYKEQYTSELESVPDEDSYEAYSKKAAIHNNWVNAIATEIETTKSALATATPDQKNDLENKIAVLENNKLEQEEFVALYNVQAESMRTTEPIANNNTSTTNSNQPSTNNEEPTTNNNQPTTNNNQPVASELSKEIEPENLTANNLNSPEDEFSYLKYNNQFNYRSNQSKKAIEPVTELKNEAKTLKEEAEVKSIAANNTRNQTEKEKLTTEAAELIDKSNRKEEQIAGVYETANRNEFYNNQAVISSMKSDNDDPYANRTIMSDLLIDEAENYYEQAKQKREEAAEKTTFTSKQIALQEAYELEMKAIEKQKMAIVQLDNGNATELLANNNSARVNNEEPTTNNEEPITNNNQPSTNNEEPVTNNNQPSTNNEEPTANTPQVSNEDAAVLLSLKSAEIVEIKNSEEYQNYAELKAENRRLVKEAEVEYVEAEKFEQEAKDQQQLGVSLKAMAEGAATPEDKEKKLAQIAKLEKMIAENEAKANEKKLSAAEKEKQAKEASDKSDFILINTDENTAKNFTSIEKVEAADPEFLAKAMNRTTQPTTNTEEPLANNEEPVTNNEEPTTNNNEPSTNNEEPVTNNEEPVTNNEEPATNNEEPTTNNEEPTTNNEEPVTNNQPTTNNEEPVTNNNQPSTNRTTPEDIDVIPPVLNNSIFVINNNQAAYSDTKPIPKSPKLPEGLVFKVQIGAFRNPIPQNHFKGFAPIMAEDAGNGITRYTAGLFKTFNMANEAKKSIRDIGYNDAFVVAFLNGKRINMNEARAMLDGSVTEEPTFAINNNTPATNNNTPATNNNQPATNNNQPATNTEEVNDGVSTDVRNIDGVFYAIQVGVYSKPVSAGQLNNVSPLNSERTTSGLIRYTSGVYKFLEDANAAKDRIRALGITDAFIVAYNGGTKITVAEATQLLSTGNSGNITPEETTPEEITPEEITPEEITPEEITPEEITPEEITPEEITPEETTPEETTPEETTPEETTPVNNDLNLEFKVKLGEYEEDVPVEDAGIFLKLTGRGVKNYEEDDKTIYTIGSFPDYESALDLQIEMKEMSVKNPKTIVFRDGKEIDLAEALELMKNNQ